MSKAATGKISRTKTAAGAKPRAKTKDDKKTGHEVEKFLEAYHAVNDKFFQQFFTWRDMRCDERQSVTFTDCTLTQALPYFSSHAAKCTKPEECHCDELSYPVGTKVKTIQFHGDEAAQFHLTIADNKYEFWAPLQVTGKFMTSYEVEETTGFSMPYYMI